MPPSYDSPTLINPYASSGDGTAARTVRVAARAMAVGAIGLGAVATITGTGAADEADPAGSETSETSEVVAAETAADSGAAQQVVDDPAPDGAGSGLENGGLENSDLDETGTITPGEVLVADTPEERATDETEVYDAELYDAEPVSADDRAVSEQFTTEDLGTAGFIDVDLAEAEVLGSSTTETGTGSTGGPVFADPAVGGDDFGPSVERLELDGVPIGDLMQQFREYDTAQVQLPTTITLPDSARRSIDAARRQVPAGETEPRVRTGAIGAKPQEFQIAPGVRFVSPSVGFGEAKLDLDLGEGRIGVTDIPANLGQLILERSGRAPLTSDNPTGPRLTGRSATTVTLNPQTLAGYLLGGPATDVAPVPENLNAQTANRAGVSIGTSAPADPLTGNQRANWAGAQAFVGANGDVTFANGENSVVPSGNVSFPIGVAGSAGVDNPNDRWGVSGSATLTPQATLGVDPDRSTRFDAAASLGGSLGPRTGEDGNIARGVRVGGELFGNYTSVNGLQVAVPNTTDRVETDQTQSNVGLRAEFQARESQETSAAGIRLNGEAGLRGSSIETVAGSNSTGLNPHYRVGAQGDVSIATAPQGQTRGIASLDARGDLAYDGATAATTYTAEGTGRLGGEFPLGNGNTTLTTGVGYTAGVNNAGGYGGLRGDVGVETNAFGGRLGAGGEYRSGNPDGGDSVAFKVDFTPGGARETPRPQPVTVGAPLVAEPVDDVSVFDPGGDLGFSGVPLDPSQPTVQPAPAVDVGPVSESASDLLGTSAVGIGITDPVAAVEPLNASSNEPVVDIPVMSPLDVPEVGVPASDGLMVSLDTPLVDMPALDAPEAFTEPMVDMSTFDAPTFDAAPLPAADLSGFSSPALDSSSFSGSIPSFDAASLDTGSFGGFGGFGF